VTPRIAGEALRRAAARGADDTLAELYAEDAVLDASLPGGRDRIRLAGPIAAWLGTSWAEPAEVTEWTVGVHPAGFELWMERIDSAAILRTRQYAWVQNGRITRHWIYATPPRTAPPDQHVAGDVQLDLRLLAGLGQSVVEHEPVVSRGWSGNVLERLVLADGSRLVAKRIVPGHNWIERHTADEGREALLFRSGVLERVQSTIDHAIVAAERDGDAWWVVMKDVSDGLLPDHKRLSRDENRRILAAANHIWEEFWGEEVPYLCPLRDRLCLFSPAIAESE
jgi:hypothetical protein